MKRDRTRLTPRSREILTQIARGHSYDQILSVHPGLTYRNIFRAAHEALKLLGPDTEAAEGVARPVHIQNERLLEIRAKHPRAYEPWSAEEDAKLRIMLMAGQNPKTIAAELQRQVSAVTRRIAKLGLDVKSR
ncbi:MAG: hypothetical protein JXQ75_06230 [Phycisphaerae bacterium]|nr:hypothetical protein [Phycisphaerae bacterium]